MKNKINDPPNVSAMSSAMILAILTAHFRLWVKTEICPMLNSSRLRHYT